MPHSHNITYFHHQTEKSEIGHVSAGARVNDSDGTPGSDLRKLGCYALVYVLSGKCEYYDRHQARRIESGDLILLFPDEIHAYGPKGDDVWNELYLLFEGPAFDLWKEQGIIDPAQPILNLQPVDIWKGRFMDIVEKGTSPLQQTCRLQAFLADAQQSDRYLLTEDSDRQWLTEANILIGQNAIDSEGVRQAATGLGMSYESFRKKYKHLAGISPGQYRASKLIEKAVQRIAETALPLCTIAEELGFCDEFHFSRRFKQITGVTPGTYRRRLPRWTSETL